MFNFFNEVNDFTQQSMEAALETMTGFERGVTAFSNEWNQYAERSMRDGQKSVERMLKADSVETALEAQSEFAQTAYDTYLGHMSRFSGLYARMAEDTCKPVKKLKRTIH